MRRGNAMTNSSTSHTISPEHIMQVGLGFWASKTLLSAVEMELFTLLAKQPGTVEILQGRLGLHRDRLATSSTRSLPSDSWNAKTAFIKTLRPWTNSWTKASSPTLAACSKWRTFDCSGFGMG